MSRVLPIVSLCIALLAFAFAVVPRDPVIIPSSEPEAQRGVDVDAEMLRRRVELLEDDNRALWDRVVVLERRNPSVVMSDAGVFAPSMVSEVAQLRQEVRGLITGEVLSNEASRAALKDVIREAEADALRERVAQSQQRREQRAQEQKVKWKEFVSTAKLTWQQEQELTKHLEAEEKARLDLAQQLQVGNTAPGPDAFRAMRDQRRETDEAMNKLLDDTQKQQYQALRREDRGGNRGGDRGGDRQQPK